MPTLMPSLRLITQCFTYFLGVFPLLAAEGPGIPNVAYDAARVGENLSKTDPGKAISAIALHRGYLFVPLSEDHGGGQGHGAFAFYNVNHPSAPQNVFDSRNYPNRYHNSATLDYVGDWAELHHLPISGSTMVISERRSGSAGFSIFDIAPLYDDDPITFPRTLSRFSYPGVTWSSNYDGYSFALGWQGRRYVYAPTGGDLFVIDTTDLSNPVLLSQRLRSQLSNLTLRQAIPIGNILILTTAAIENQFDAIIMDISDPGNPVLLSSFSGPNGYQGFVYGSAFYGGGSPIQRHDFSNPASVVTTTLQSGTNFERPEYGYGKDGYLFIGHYPGATKWRLNGNSAEFVTNVNSGIFADHAFLAPLGNLIALCSDQQSDRRLMISIHDPEKDVTGPVPLFVSPANGKTGAHIRSRVGISFSDTIDPMSLNSSTMTIREFGSTTAIPGTYSAMVGIVNFAPNQDLKQNTTYEVVLAAGGVKDQSGNGVAQGTVLSQFSTGNGLNSFIMRINTTTPTTVGSQVTLSATVTTSSTQQLEHSWNFGDGSAASAFSSATTATHTYSTAGNHSVTLRSRFVGTTTVTGVSATQVIHHPISATPPVASSTILSDPTQPLVWNVNPDNDSVTAIHTVNLNRVYEITVGKNPRTLAMGPSNTLWVVNKQSATVSVINRSTGTVSATHSLPAGSAPHGIVIHSGAAYVSLEASGQVIKLNSTTGAVMAILGVGPWPRALALDPATQLLWVARFISPEVSGVVTRINLSNFTALTPTPLAIATNPDSLTNGRGLPNYLGAMVISPDLTQLYVPSKKDNIARGTSRDGLPLTFEHTVRSMAANINLATAAENASKRIDFDNSDFASAAAFSPLGNLVLFTTSGSTTVWVVDAYAPANRSSFTSGGLAPDGLAFNAAGTQLFIHNFMDRSVTVFDSTFSRQIGKVGTVSQEKLPSQVLLGKQLFYDTTSPHLAQEGYMSCASCHLDGGHDGRVWDFTSLDEGLRNTIDLTGRGISHGPSHWTGNFDEIQDFEGQIRSLSQGKGLMDNKDFLEGNRSAPLGAPKAGISPRLDALAAYIHSLQTVGRSPHRNTDGSLTTHAAAGRLIFQQENCASCHGGNTFADSISLDRHDVGTLRSSSGKRLGAELDGLDTPTLRGLWKSAPYLHDGSAATVREVLKERDISGRHGNLFHRTTVELDQLVAYILSIDDLEVTAPSGNSGGAPVLTIPSAQQTAQHQQISLTLQATGSGPFRWHALSLPEGLFLDTTSGIITGAPSRAGTYTARIGVRDAAGRSAEMTISWTVSTRGDPNRFRYVKLIADSDAAGAGSTAVPDFQLFDGLGNWHNRASWSATANTQETAAANNSAPLAIDSSTTTLWHSAWTAGSVIPQPHELVIDLGSAQIITGFSYLPRQDMASGRIGNWRFLWSKDKVTWILAAQGTFPAGTARQNVAVSTSGNGIPYETWPGINGSAVSDLTNHSSYLNSPSASQTLTRFEAPSNFADNYGSRIHGFLIPPTTGDYTFWIASDDSSQLSLSPDRNPANAALIASVNGFTSPKNWTSSPSQRSAPIRLFAGVRYYIRALHKEGGGGDHLAVAWEGPGFSQQVIPESALTPFRSFESVENEVPQIAATPNFTGNGIPYEMWTGITGSAVADLTNHSSYLNSPSASQTLTSFEAPSNFADNYGSRIHGFLIPPTTGDYTFWIASDDSSQLSLSPDRNPANAALIASVSSYTSPKNWTSSPSQRSAPIRLLAGVRYYIRALHKEGVGGDHLAVAWEGPGFSQQVIPGSALTPFESVESGNPQIAATPNFTVVENSASGTVVGAVSATDLDSAQILSYLITGGNSAGHFSIDASTGVLRVAGAIDFETLSSYRLTISVRDSGTPQLTASTQIRVGVINVIETNSEMVSLTIAGSTGSFPGHGNPALIGFDADPDNDGIPNAIELLFGTNPATVDTSPPMRMSRSVEGGKTYMVYEFNVASNIDPALGFDCVGSTALSTWQRLSRTPELISSGSGIRTYRVRDDMAIEDAPRRFIRISISAGASSSN